MSGIESYFDNLGDNYLYDNIILQRDISGDGYYIEKLTDNITKPQSYPSFNKGSAFTPSLEEQLEEEYQKKMPKTREELMHNQQKRNKALKFNVYKSGRSERPYDDASDVLEDSFNNQGRQYNQKPASFRNGFGNRM